MHRKSSNLVSCEVDFNCYSGSNIMHAFKLINEAKVRLTAAELMVIAIVIGPK